MRKFLTSILEKLLKKIKEKEPEIIILDTTVVEETLPKNKEKNVKIKQKVNAISLYKKNPARDLMEMMEVPFLALSKNRRNPIIYESLDGRIKVKVSRHTGHFLASIYDWDIILFVASKMQRILNEMSDIPPRSMIVPRHELLKAIHRRNGKKTDIDLEKTLSRLQLTGMRPRFVSRRDIRD